MPLLHSGTQAQPLEAVRTCRASDQVPRSTCTGHRRSLSPTWKPSEVREQDIPSGISFLHSVEKLGLAVCLRPGIQPNPMRLEISGVGSRSPPSVLF